MKKIHLLLFASELHDQVSVLGSRAPGLEFLRQQADRQHAELRISRIEDYEGGLQEDELALAFIGTGGAEELFLRYRDRLPRPWTLLSDGLHNSLAATQEIVSWISQNQGEALHLHGFESLTLERMALILQFQQAFAWLSERNIGLIGGVADWLIASHVDYEALQRKWGFQTQPIDISVLEHGYRAFKNGVKTHARNLAQIMTKGACKVVEPNQERMEDAAHLYLALSELCTLYQLNALTIRCFDLLKSQAATPCMALSRLNDQGIISGCEGDFPALWSMLLVKALTRQPSFMANPSDMQPANSTLDLAHCTIPLAMCERYSLRDHFESRLSVGLQGELPPGTYTLFKCGGPHLDRYFVTEADWVSTEHLPQRCRTQLRLRTHRPVTELISAHLGNHVVVVKGAHKNCLDAFLQLFGLKGL